MFPYFNNFFLNMFFWWSYIVYSDFFCILYYSAIYLRMVFSLLFPLLKHGIFCFKTIICIYRTFSLFFLLFQLPLSQIFFITFTCLTFFVLNYFSHFSFFFCVFYCFNYLLINFFSLLLLV